MSTSTRWPVQSGSTRVLQAMRRRHTREEYLELVGRLREAMPDIALSTDMIVGFPGETEAEFDHLVESVRRLKFDRVGVFTYSDEDGTAAFGMPDRVPEADNRRRRGRLMAAARDITLASNRQLIGQELEVLVEGRPEDGSAWYAARSYRDAPEVDGLVLVKADDLPVGEIIRVKVERALAYDLLARPV